MKVEKFAKEIEAVYFDGITDVQEIADWCGGMVVELVAPDQRIRTDMYIIDIPIPGGYASAGADFYIIKDGESFFPMDKLSFLDNFKAQN